MINTKGKLARFSRRPLIVVGVVFLLLLGVVAGLEVTNHTHFFHKKPLATFPATPTTGGASENSQKGEAQNSQPASDTTTQPGDAKSNSGGSTSAILETPSGGNFVSNHHPSLSGTTAPNTITSVCTTTPGASCTIRFTKNSTSVQLPPQTTDRGGSAYWNDWKLQDVGLTTGSWQVQAVASLNGQSKTADDALTLEVAP